MSRIIKEREILTFEGLSLNDLLNEKFLEKINKKKLDLNPINIIFMAQKEEEGKQQFCPIILSHESRKEIETKVLHINIDKKIISDDFIKILEEIATK